MIEIDDGQIEGERGVERILIHLIGQEKRAKHFQSTKKRKK